MDDKFFSLRQMEEFCDEQEKNEGEDVLSDDMYDQLYGGEPADLLGTNTCNAYKYR